MKLRIHSQAEAEIRAAAQWYEDHRTGLSDEFLSEAYDAMVDIRRHPQRFSPVLPGLRGRDIRRRLLERFPYAVVYQVTPDCIRVVAVAHTSRKPGYWRDRVG